MKQKVFSFFKYLFFLAIGLLLSWWQLGKMTADQRIQFQESLRSANYSVLLPVIIMSLLSHLSRAMRWKLLMEPLLYKPRLSNAFYALMAGYFANTFVPRAGEVLRCTLLSKYEKIPFPRLIGSVLLERVFDLFCYTILVLFTILLQLNTVGNFLKKTVSSFGKASSGSLIPLLIFLAAVAGLIVFTRWLLKRYAAHRHVIKFRQVQIGLKEGFSTIIHLRKRGAFLGHTVFIWAMYLLQIYVGFQALNITSHLGIGAAFSILSLATLAMIISPGGIGAFPVAVQQVLIVYGIANISFGWLMWGTTTAIVIVAGILSFIMLIITNRKKLEIHTTDTGENFVET